MNSLTKLLLICFMAGFSTIAFSQKDPQAECGEDKGREAIIKVPGMRFCFRNVQRGQSFEDEASQKCMEAIENDKGTNIPTNGGDYLYKCPNCPKGMEGCTGDVALAIGETYGAEEDGRWVQTGVGVDPESGDSVAIGTICYVCKPATIKIDYKCRFCHEAGAGEDGGKRSAAAPSSFNNHESSSIRLEEVYPNPNQGKFNIRIHSDQEKGQLAIRLYNLSGQLLMEDVVYQVPNGTQEIVFDAEGISQGMYLLKVYANEEAIGSSRISILE